MKENKFLSKAISAFLCLAVVVCSLLTSMTVIADLSDDGYIVDIDFETGALDTSSWKFNDQAVVTSAAAYEGNYGLHVVYNPAAGDDYTSVSTMMDVEPNTDYVLTFMMKGLTSEIGAVSIKGSNTFSSGYNEDLIGTQWPSTAANTWEQKEIIFNSGNYEYTRISFLPIKSDKYIDNIKVEKYVNVSNDGYIQNGDLEAGFAHKWTVQGSAGTDVTNTQKHNGDYSLNLKGSGSEDYSNVAKTNTFSVLPNTDYKLTFWMMGTDTEASAVYIKGSANQTTGFNDIKSDWPNTASNTWEEKTYNFNSGDNNYVFIEFARVNGDKYIDDVKFELNVNATNDGYVINGDFETGTTIGWKINGSGSEVTADAAKYGSYGMYLAGSEWDGFETTITVEQGKDYRLSFDFYDLVGNGKTSPVYIKANNSSGTLLNEAWFSGKKNEWGKQMLTFNSGTSTRIYIQFCRFAGEKYIDNISVSEISVTEEVQNGSFENSLNGWNTAGTNDVTDKEAHSGQYSLLISGPAAWTKTTQDVKVSPHSTYLLTFWAKVPGNGGNSIYKIIGNNTGNNITGDQFFHQATNGWRCYAIPFNSSDNTQVTLNFEYGEIKNNIVYIDDVSLVRYRETNDLAELLTNAGFETGWFDGYVNTGAGHITTDDADEGTRSLVLNGPVTGSKIYKKIKVQKNTNYTVDMRVKADGAAFSSASISNSNNLITLAEKQFAQTNGWEDYQIVFNSGDNNFIYLNFVYGAGGADVYVDDIKINIYDVADKAVITNMYPEMGGGKLTADEDLIGQGGFESVEDAAWETGFLIDGILSVDTTNSHSGKKALHYKNTDNTKNRYSFAVPVKSDTRYVLSAWVKGALRSDTNLCNASFGVSDSTTSDFLVQLGNTLSSEDYQLAPPAWDDSWHQVTIIFQTGANQEVAFTINAGSAEFWLDDIILCPLDNTNLEFDTGIKLVDDFPEVINTSKENNLIYGDDNFWIDGENYGYHLTAETDNGMAVLNVKAPFDVPSGMHYIKWVDVEPNTEYIFSLEYLNTLGGTRVGLAQNSDMAQDVLWIDLAACDDGLWSESGFTFNSGSQRSVGIFVADTSESAKISNLRLFKSENAIASENIVVQQGQQQGNETISPATGENIILMLTVFAALLGVAFVLMPKRRLNTENKF